VLALRGVRRRRCPSATVRRAGEWTWIRDTRRHGSARARRSLLDRTFTDFAAAIAFVNRVAEAAEAADHHPDILVHGYRRVRLTLTTHSAGRLTEKDADLARVIDGL
jgi:4a-hydroxytetrahydrobiopterin dehydratase